MSRLALPFLLLALAAACDRTTDPVEPSTSNDLDSGLRSTHGEFTAKAASGGVIAHVAGLDTPDGTHHRYASTWRKSPWTTSPSQGLS
jgi:hypothetical protein